MMSLTFWFLWIKPDVICYFVIFERNKWILLPFGTKVSKLSDSLSSLFKKILSVNVSPDDVAAITPSSFNAEWCQSWHVLLSKWISQNVKLLHQECKIHFKSCFQLAFSLISFSPFPLCCMSSLPINVCLLFSDLIKTLYPFPIIAQKCLFTTHIKGSPFWGIGFEIDEEIKTLYLKTF